MTLNKTKIDWCDVTWNPVTGCKHGCQFCYARKIATRFAGTPAFPNGFIPTMHPDRLDDPKKEKTPQVVFVCSMADLFGDWLPEDWITNVMWSCSSAPQHQYLFLTKNPRRICNVLIEELNEKPIPNWWLGCSVGETTDSWMRIHDMKKLQELGWNTFLSIEPLTEAHPMIADGFGAKWVIIGMLSNGSKTVPCKRFTLDYVTTIARLQHIPIFMKESVQKVFPDVPVTHEMPTGLPLPRKWKI